MSTSTPEIVDAHLESIHFLASKTEVLSDSNRPKTLRKLDMPDSMEMREHKYLNNGKGLTQFTTGFRTIKSTAEFDVTKGSTVLATIKAAYAARTPVWIACVTDATAPTGSQGLLYEVVVGSYPKMLEAGTIVSVTIEMGVNDFTPI